MVLRPCLGLVMPKSRVRLPSSVSSIGDGAGVMGGHCSLRTHDEMSVEEECQGNFEHLDGF